MGVFDIDQSWDYYADMASRRSRLRRPIDSRNLRFCPGTYTDPKTKKKIYCDVWLKRFLEEDTPFDTFEELFKHVKFNFEEVEERNEQHESSSRTS